MWAHIDFIDSILETEVPLDQLKKLEGTLLDIEKSTGRRGRLSYYLLLQVQNENHRFPLCFSSHEKWEWAKKVRGQSVTIWLRPEFKLIYWEDCVDQIKHGNNFLRDYSARLVLCGYSNEPRQIANVERCSHCLIQLAGFLFFTANCHIHFL